MMARGRKTNRTAVIADDHSATADGLERWLVEAKLTVTARVRHLRDIVSTVEAKDPGLFICDLRFTGEGNALPIIAAAIEQGTIRCPVIIYTSYDDHVQMKQAWDAGVSAWVLKGESREFVMDVVARVMKAERVFPEMKAPLPNTRRQPRRYSTVDGVEVTMAQAAMLLAVHAGERREEIARHLDLSLSSVNHEIAEVRRHGQFDSQARLMGWINRNIDELRAVVVGESQSNDGQ
jgi:DNA-binding NarL/FixJ family response regulator